MNETCSEVILLIFNIHTVFSITSYFYSTHTQRFQENNCKILCEKQDFLKSGDVLTTHILYTFTCQYKRRKYSESVSIHNLLLIKEKSDNHVILTTVSDHSVPYTDSQCFIVPQPYYIASLICQSGLSVAVPNLWQMNHWVRVNTVNQHGQH